MYSGLDMSDKRVRSIRLAWITLASLLVVATISLVMSKTLALSPKPPTATLLPQLTATPRPTDTPQPSPTAIDTSLWKPYTDPYERYALRYPPGWFVRQATSESLGFASAGYITSFDLSAHFEGKEGELVVPSGEFLISLEFIPEVVDEARLASWVKQRSSGIATTTETSATSIGGLDVVMQLLQFGPGYHRKQVFFRAPSGVLVISGEPVESPTAEIFEPFLSTLTLR